MYEEQTKAAILQRMLDASPSDIDKRQGSVTNDLLSPASIELALAYVELDNVLAFGFAGTTYGAYLDLRANEYGLTRKPAVKSVGTLTFSGPDGTVIPIGTEASTGGNNPIFFVTTVAGTIAGGIVTVASEAVAAGASSNVILNTVTFVIGDLAGVITVNNAANFTDGVDTESDADLSVRYFERVRRPATSGNAYQYRQWALAATGVGDARVFPLWAGAGTVKVTIITQEREPASAPLISDVAQYIEEQRPIGATVTVDTAIAKLISVSATVTIASSYTLQQVSDSFQAALVAHLREIAFTQSYVSYAKVGTLLLGTQGIVDYTALTVNGGTNNVAVADGEVAIIGTVSLGV